MPYACDKVIHSSGIEGVCMCVCTRVCMWGSFPAA